MNDIIQNLQADCFNGEKYFCLMSENKLNALKELSKREEQENQQLKEKVDKQYNKIVEKDNMLSNRYGVIEHKQQQLDLYKSVFDEVREYIKENSNIYLNIMGNKVGFFTDHNDGHTPVELLEILDKVKGSDK